MAEPTNYIGQSQEQVTITRWLVCPTGSFTNPPVGSPTISFPLAVRRQEGTATPRDVLTGKRMNLSVSDPPQIIPHIDPATFQQVQTRDENGDLIPGTYFTGDYGLFVVQCLFAYAVNNELEAGTITQDVNPLALPELAKVLQAMGVQP